MADSLLSRLVGALFSEAHAATPPQPAPTGNPYPTAPMPVVGDIMRQQLDPHTYQLYNTTPLAPPTTTTTTLPANAPGLTPPTDPNEAGRRDQAWRVQQLGETGSLTNDEYLNINAKQMRKYQHDIRKLQRGQMQDLHSLLRHGTDPAMADTILKSLLDSGAIYEESPGQVGSDLPHGGKNANRRFLEYLLDFSRRTGQVPMPRPTK